MPYIEFLNVTIPMEWFNYAFFFMLGMIICLLISMRSLARLKKVVDQDTEKFTRSHDNLINKMMEFLLEVGLRTGINVKHHLKILEEMKMLA